VDPVTGQIWVAEPQSGNGRILRYPEFSILQNMESRIADFVLGTFTPPVAMALDNQGRLVAAEVSNRVSFYYPPLWVTNAANFLPNGGSSGALAQPCCAPGSAATLWPLSPSGTFGAMATIGASSVPLPKVLDGVALMISASGLPDTPAPLYMVSPGQINFQVPKNAPTDGTVDFTLMRQSSGEILATGSADVRSASPGLFVNFASPVPLSPVSPAGSLQVIAFNHDDMSCNGVEIVVVDRSACPGGVRPARRGEVVTVYATGQGLVSGMPEDGEVGNSQPVPDPTLRIVFSTGDSITPDVSRLAPDLVGAWQIDFRVPNTAQGPVRIAISYKDRASSVLGFPITVLMVQ